MHKFSSSEQLGLAGRPNVNGYVCLILSFHKINEIISGINTLHKNLQKRDRIMFFVFFF